ncbi:MAG: gliding motility-associated C-terminal domain-containing protein [Taibaiella sp.]|jgi:gliding motility-associated-like protein
MRVLTLTLTSILFFGMNLCNAQNLVHNGGFEEYIYPPTGSGLLLEDFVHDWASYYNTPDYFSTQFMGDAGMLDYCGTLPHGGKGIIGAYVLGYFSSMPAYNREYIQGELSEPLKANTMYYAEMYVKPMLKAPVINFGIDKLGIAFTDKHYNFATVSDLLLIEEVPEVENKLGVITDRNTWTKVSGCFIAEGGETKIIIGNFRIDEETDSTMLPGAFGEEQFHYGMSYFLFDDILVKEIPLAYILPGDTLICRDSIISLSAYPDDAATYIWSIGATTQIIQTGKSGTLTVDITTKEGCKQEAAVTINTKYCGSACPQLFMPNAFSPNEDGRNDYFQPMNAIDMSSLEFSVYNRFGERLFYGKGLQARWDGRFKDKPCDAGTYFYYSRYSDCRGTELTKKGDIVLVR